jgi:hypothetical protein
MPNELTVIKPQDYELDESKGKEVCASFAPAIDKKVSMIPEYEEILTKEINAETCKLAGDLRKRLVKVRTQGIEATRKAQKNFALKFGQFVDAFAKKETVQLQLMESNLSDIEKHFENAEKERIEKIRLKRVGELAEYEVDEIAFPAGLGEMDESVWTNYVAGVREAYCRRKEEEKKAEAERIAKEKAEAEERERVRLENEKLKAEAIEREKKEAEAQAERERIEKERLAKEKAEREAREKAEVERIAKEAEERRKIEEKARKEREEAQAKIDAERKERERLEQEKAEREAKEKAEREAVEAREKDKAHRKTVNNSVADSISELGVDRDKCIEIVKAIAKGSVPHVTINY